MDLGKKIGPFPIGGWLGIGAVGAGLGLLLNRSSLFDGAPEEPMPTMEEAAGAPTAGYGGSGMPTTGPVTLPQYGTVSPPPTVDAMPTTNGEWVRAVGSYLVVNMGFNAGTVDAALRKYLNGTDPGLSLPEREVVDRALASKFGAPPEGAPPIRMATAPVQSPTAIPTPPAGTSPTVLGKRVAQVQSKASASGGRRGETPIELAMRLYGTTEWKWIAKFNPSIRYVAGGGSKPLPAGMSILY